MTSRRHLLQWLAAGPAAMTLPGLAQTVRRPAAVALPRPRATRPLKILVGFRGSTPDLPHGPFQKPLAKLLGQPVVVENAGRVRATSPPTWWPSPPTTTPSAC